MEGVRMSEKFNLKVMMVLGITMIFIFSGLDAQTINVTMILNTSTNLDTLSENHVAWILGECTGPTNPQISWNPGEGIQMENIGGDYWIATFQMNPDDTLKYKFWTGFDNSTGTFFWNGWEGPLTPVDPVDGGGNRIFISGDQDTVLKVQYYNSTEQTRDQFWRPYEEKEDTVAVYFRVNMAALIETEEFDPENDRVVVRGGAPIDTNGGAWDTDVELFREEGSILNGSFYSGVAYIPVSDITPGSTTQSYKFVVLKSGSGEIWESISDRWFTFSSLNDTTIHWVYFNDTPPSGGNLVEATVTWKLNIKALEMLGFFDRSIDSIVIDGARGWNIDNAIRMTYNPILRYFVGQSDFKKAPGAELEYKYVILWDSSRIDPESENYIPGLNLLQYWEEPSVTGTGNRYYTYTSGADQSVPGDYDFEYNFFNGLPPEGVIKEPIDITFNVDMTPATSEETNPANPLFRPGTDTVWVTFTGCLMPLTQGLPIYGSRIQLSDTDGDLIYSGTMHLEPPTTFGVSFHIQYSSESGVIENGGGFTFGRAYCQFIRPVAVAEDTVIWPNTYSFPVVQWKDGDLPVEEAPDLWTPFSIDSDDNAIAEAFTLNSIYPNPFNPSANIAFELRKEDRVKIVVYDITGRVVRKLIDNRFSPGSYALRWNGKNDSGMPLPSGIYFVKISTSGKNIVKKVTLIR
ncbi:MAG: hypothetical protein DRP91_04775 [Candidatus Neomarinimicrobiota bacterium]|nr:MAG: hypothetical protein DRP91_04775 [Candidatus Neomarinimicrobiota bacterium]